MAILEANEETPIDLPSKYQQAMRKEYDLLEFAINIAEEFKKAVKKTKGACAEFFRRLLITYNRCQVEAEHIMDTFPEHSLFLEMLQRRYQEDGQRIQHIKALDEQTLRNEVAHSVVSVQFLEVQLRLRATRIEVIRNQAAKFEINIHFLEPSELKSIASEASTWKKFLNSQAGPSS